MHVRLGYSAERAPLGGDFAPCQIPQRMVVERRENGKRKLSTRRILEKPKICLKRSEVRAGSGQMSKLQFPHYWLPSPTGAAMIGALHQERVQRLVRRGAVLKTLCKGQGQDQVRSPKVTCWTV